MGITRTVTTQVYCDVCGKWVIGWESEGTGASREWAKYHARRKGCTAGQKVICKECRIKQRIKKCSLQKKMGRSRNGRRRLSGIFTRRGRRAYRTLQALHSLHKF